MFKLTVTLCSEIILFFIISIVSGQKAPTCNPHVERIVNELEPVGFIVHTIQCMDPDGDQLSYSIYSGNLFDKFEMDSGSGELKLAKPLGGVLVFRYDLKINVRDNSPQLLNTEVTIIVSVRTVNEFDPVMSNLPLNIDIREDIMIGTKLASCNITDDDFSRGTLAGKTRTSVIKLTSAGARRWVMDFETCDLYINTVVDYENKRGYKIGIVGYDLDPWAARTVTQSMVINVLDVNDNYPVCSTHYQIVDLPEDTPVGETIVTLICSDLDSGLNKDVYFKLSDNKNTAETKDRFSITPRNGQLQIKTGLDYETSQFYDINIDVYDGGQEISLTTTVIVGVVISDVDDNVPVWDDNVITTEVKETTPLGTVIYVVSAKDIDEPNTPDSSITYGVHRPPVPKWFDIYSETGAVYAIDTISWSIAPWVTMEVLAYSSDKVNDFNTVTLNISIIDENNVAPRFDQDFYQGNILEGSPVGTYLFTVYASDPEYGSNGQVEYSINSPYFQIDSISGNITLKKEVDFETDTVFSLNVEASDKGDPIQRGYTFLLINVLPVNEFTPVISSSIEPVMVPENTEPGTFVYQLNVTDDDIGLDGSVTFSIDNTEVPFTIESKTGILRVGSQLDIELIPQYDVIVVATDDSSTNPKSSSVTLSVVLTDANDHPPICQPLSNIVLKLPHELNTVLATIMCTDEDVTSNNEFFYTITSGDDLNTFDIDQSTGNIVLANEPQATKYSLEIQVEDNGDPALNSIVPFNILAELQFNFSNIPTTISVPENTELAQELFDVDACCVFSYMSFELISGNQENHVVIDPSSGKLILMYRFDREEESTFIYGIKALSRDTNSTAESYLEILIEDVNDNTPQFEPSFQHLTVSEQFAVNTKILQFTVIDKDEGVNSEVKFNLKDGNTEGVFFVSDSGILSLNSSLDAETTSQYTLIVTASDGGDPSLTGTTTVVVDVLNVNEYAPQIVNVQDGFIYTNVSEDEALGAPIFSLLAEDRDVDTAFSYQIIQGNDDLTFVIDGSTGNIYLAKLLDRETIASYNLTVEVMTSNNETVSAVVSIDVLDVNDKDPKFSQDVYQLEVTHEDPPNTLVTSFIITDDDIGTNKDIASLTIVSGDPGNQFKIEGKNLLTGVVVDFYQQNVYTLEVQATDNGSPSRSGFARVLINVLPRYKPPQFVSSDQTTTVREDVVSGGAVYDLNATSAGGTEGPAGTIQYLIRSGNEENKFYLSDTDGILRVTSTLDFEETETHTLIVEAKSREDGLLSSSATLTINIENVNDNIPVFNSSVYNFVINEDAANGEVVGAVYADDADKLPFGNVSYFLGTAQGSTDFTIDPTGIITVAGSLDIIRQNVYNIPIIASDGGVRQGEALVVIQLIDVNDNSPIFTPENLTIEVSESSDIGLTVYTVKAEDLDIGINGEIGYSFVTGNSDGKFDLDSDSGAVTILKELDREAIPRFDLVIQAEDKAITGQRSGTLSLTVNVADVNDQDPIFPNSLEEVEVERDDPSGTLIMIVRAEDRDIGSNADLSYEISSGNLDGMFVLDSQTGELSTASPLGSAQNEYRMVITASDQGFPFRTGSTTIKIQILPFVVTGTSDQTLSVLENLPPGQEVGIVTPKNGHESTAVLTYTIEGGNYQNRFAINSASGMITTSKTLDREEYPSYILKINIQDNFSVSYSKSVTVDVLDANDNVPVIQTNDQTINVVENTPAGQIIASFTVTDADEGQGGKTTLSISPVPLLASLYFEIRDSFLVIKTPLDYETVESLNISIVVLDGGEPQLSSLVNINVNVIDVQDSERSITSGPEETPSIYLSTETSYLAPNEELVTQLTAKDFGMTSNSITFTTLDTEGVFKVSTTGEVTVQKETLLVAGEKYFVWLVANGQSNNNKTSTLGLLRIDTFDPNYHVASLESSVDAETLQKYKEEMTLSLRKYFRPEDMPKIWKTIPYGTLASRKLLAAASQTLVYVIVGPYSNDIVDIDQKKTFMNMSEIVDVLRLASSQTVPQPGLSTPNFPVDAVNAFTVPDEPEEPAEGPTFVTSLEGYITFTCLALLLLLIILLILIYCCYKKKKREQRRLRNSNEMLVPDDQPDNRVRYGVDKVYKDSDVSPLTPYLVDVPLAGSTSRTAAPAPLARPQLPPLRSEPPSDIQSRFTPMPPVGTTRDGDEDIQPSGSGLHEQDSVNKKKTLPPIEKKVLPLSIPETERKGSTIDLHIDDTIDSPTYAVVNKKRDGPVVYRGREYDGVGFDTDTNRSYAYNTRTGSTLWVEKNIKERQGNKEKKKSPLLTVVSEAKADYSPNLNLNRSVSVIHSKDQ